METGKEPVAVVAGAGALPEILARRLYEMNMLSAVIVVQGDTGRFGFLKRDLFEIPPGKVGDFLKILEDNKITRIIMIGKIDKQGFVEREGFDQKAMEMLKRIKDGMDLSIFKLLLDELDRINVQVLQQDLYLNDLLISKGVLTRRPPGEEELKDAEFGLEQARKLASMDIGQTVIVKNKTILAVEAIEGTDETIKRGGLLGKNNSAVCKAARRNQDSRFDIPGIGKKTIEVMAKYNCSLLAVEAGRLFMVDRDEVIGLADRNNISIIGL